MIIQACILKEDPGSLDCELDWQREMREIIAELEEKVHCRSVFRLFPEIRLLN